MARPITLFTGQWADLPFEEVCRLAGEWGYDGLEIACWGDHFEVDRALTEDGYIESRHEILTRYGLKVWAISNHLVGQAVCDDPIDQRHQDILPAAVWGDGDPEGVRRRAAERMADTARAAAKLGVDTVIGFTGSSIWKYVAMFPPVSDEVIQEGYADFARRWNPILDVYDEVGVRFAHEVHPSEIAYDYWTTVATLEAIGHRPAFGLNWDPSHMVWQDLDPAAFIWDFKDRIYHVDCKDARKRIGNGRNGRLSSHLPWSDPRRATVTCRGRTASAPSTRSATTARSRSNGRTPVWTASSGRRAPSSTSGRSTSTSPRPPSTPPSRPGIDPVASVPAAERGPRGESAATPPRH